MKISRQEEGWKIYYYTSDITIVESPEGEQEEIDIKKIYVRYIKEAKACETRQEMYQVYMNALPKDIPTALKEYIVRWYRNDYNLNAEK